MDNVTFQSTTTATPPVGAIVGADLCTVNAVAGVLVPLGKVGFGDNDTFSYVTSSVGLPVGDAGGSLTVDAPVGTPVFIRLSDGTAPIVTLPVSVAGSVAVTGTFFQATQPISGTVTANAGSGVFPVSATNWPLPTGAATSAKQPAFGTAGTAAADVVSVQGVASMTALKVDGSAVTQPVSGSVALPAATTGGATGYHYIAAASANQDSQSVKGSAGTLYAVDCGNPSAAVRYVKLYDKATAPTSGDTPFKTIFLPAGGGNNPPIPTCGIAFALGLGLRITTGVADSDANAATANDVAVNLACK